MLGLPSAGGGHRGQGSRGKGRAAGRGVLNEAEGLSGQHQGRPVGAYSGERTVRMEVATDTSTALCVGDIGRAMNLAGSVLGLLRAS